MVGPVEAWVEWLEQAGQRLVRDHKSTFECLRRTAPPAACPTDGD